MTGPCVCNVNAPVTSDVPEKLAMLCVTMLAVVAELTVKLFNGNRACRTFLIPVRDGPMTSAHADVVRIAAATASANAAKPTHSTTDHGTQQIGIGSIVASCKLLIVSQFGLNTIKLLLADHCWNLCHGSPFLAFRLDMSSSSSTNGNQGRVSPTCFDRTTPSNVDRARVDRMSENASDARLIPSCFPGRAADAQAC